VDKNYYGDLKAKYTKKELQDPQSNDATYANFTLNRDVEFCCESFRNFCKKFTVWDYSQAKFAIVDKITYDDHSVQPIDYCPFCGEKIEYENTENSKKRKNI
jgi:hypothetical protein